MMLTDRQREIVDTAIEIIAEEGIHRLTTKELSGRIGITEPGLYRHFENKLAIMVAVLDFFGEWSADILRSIAESDRSPREKLRAIYGEHTNRFMESPATAGVLFVEEIFKDREELVKSMMRIMGVAEGYIRQILQEGLSSGDFRSDVPMEHLALMALGSLRLLVTRWRLGGYQSDLYEEGMRLADSVIAMAANSERALERVP
jgi:AcrR family transcriptional regulator